MYGFIFLLLRIWWPPWTEDEPPAAPLPLTEDRLFEAPAVEPSCDAVAFFAAAPREELLMEVWAVADYLWCGPPGCCLMKSGKWLAAPLEAALGYPAAKECYV